VASALPVWFVNVAMLLVGGCVTLIAQRALARRAALRGACVHPP
jgi:hypothetical protein